MTSMHAGAGTQAGTTGSNRAPAAARRAGYAVAIVINAAMLYGVNLWPGWQAVPFLTDTTNQVVGLVNAALAAGIVVNVAYLAHDAPWLRSLGDLATTGIGLAVLVRLWRVFPFAFSDTSVNWAFLARLVLVVGIVGSIIGILVQVVSVLRLMASGR